MDAHFTFETDGFADDNIVKAENINGIAGATLAKWISLQIRSAGLVVSEVWPEDHGWDFSITHDGATYICACSIADEEGAPFEGHIVLGKSRSMMDRLRRRGKFARNDKVAEVIYAALEHSPVVDKLIQES